MAYDRDLVNRLRELLACEPGVTEKPMFGGVAFLVGGRMSATASRQGGLMVRSTRMTLRTWLRAGMPGVT